MTVSTMTPEELELLRRIATVQEEEMVSFCIELDIVPDEPFSVDDVIERVIEALVQRAASEGLPISKYDAEDLARFSAAELTALARGLGVKVPARGDPEAIVHAIVHAMRKVQRRLPRRSQLPLMLTYFLPALVRRLAS